MKVELTRKELETLTENAANALQNNLAGKSNEYTGEALLAAAATELSATGLRKAARELKAVASREKDPEIRKRFLSQAKGDLEMVAGDAALNAHWAKIYRKLFAARLPARA